MPAVANQVARRLAEAVARAHDSKPELLESTVVESAIGISHAARRAGRSRAIGLAAEAPPACESAPAPVRADELMALLAHDLRSPLNIVLMAAELLGNGLALSDEARDHWLSVIRDAATRMNGMIGSLLEASRVEAGGLELDIRRYALRPLLVEAMSTQLPAAERQGLTITVGSCRTDVSGELDRDAMLRVLANLIDNAIRHTLAGGRVILDGEPTREGVRISVSDTGSGIPPEHLPHIFDRFWQGPTARRGSAGLGLAIVKAIVEQHGGRIAVESQPGRGACFDLFLPERTAAAASSNKTDRCRQLSDEEAGETVLRGIGRG